LDSCQKHQPEPFGHFMFRLTFWKWMISPHSAFSEILLIDAFLMLWLSAVMLSIVVPFLLVTEEVQTFSK
jgi:hypothetical protein